ncbi:hypothetical protein ACFPZ0_14390 [Streptomonospora nanhaiensis]|uniref:Uncharacterized protein n=1 Tax=Streptomonospora nanhaiensis TaxID=1323731 RepID=A0A853BM85_9ACTN|nr:hypothetical protein [Streptomonospora nanhaiensis]MBX9389942.1 hypothetical protein [Streptomonospora nanhaiensis]NYI96110.1 hypothetical protein [Streptomonospora nanhaiensis]
MAADDDRERAEIARARDFQRDALDRVGRVRTTADVAALGEALNQAVLHARRLLGHGDHAAAQAWADGVVEAAAHQAAGDPGGGRYPYQHATAHLVRGLGATGAGRVVQAADDLADAYRMLRDPAVPWPREAVRDGLIGEAATALLDLYEHCHREALGVDGDAARSYRENAEWALNEAVSLEERAVDGPRWRLALAERLLDRVDRVEDAQGRARLLNGAEALTERTDDVLAPADREALRYLSARTYRQSMEWHTEAGTRFAGAELAENAAHFAQRAGELEGRPDLEPRVRRELNLALRESLTAYAGGLWLDAQALSEAGMTAAEQFRRRREALQEAWRIGREFEAPDAARTLADGYAYLLAAAESGRDPAPEEASHLAELPKGLLRRFGAQDHRAPTAAAVLYAVEARRAGRLLAEARTLFGDAGRLRREQRHDSARAAGAKARAAVEGARKAVDRAERHHRFAAKAEKAAAPAGRPAAERARELQPAAERVRELDGLRAETARLAERAARGGGLPSAMAGRAAAAKPGMAGRRAATGTAAGRRPAPTDPAAVARGSRIRHG